MSEGSNAVQIPETASRESKTIENSQAISEFEIELQQEIINMIGVCLELDKKTAAAVHKDKTLCWSEILKKVLQATFGKIPNSGELWFYLDSKLNAEISAVQEAVIKRDKRIIEKQERAAAYIGAVRKAISIPLKIKILEKLELLENLSDDGRLLASILGRVPG